MGCKCEGNICVISCSNGQTIDCGTAGMQCGPSPCCPDPCTQLEIGPISSNTTSSVTTCSGPGYAVGGIKQLTIFTADGNCVPINPPCTTTTTTTTTTTGTTPPPPSNNCDGGGG